MPELPEVETIRRALAPVLEGRRLCRVTVRRDALRIPFPPAFAARLEGRRVRAVGRRAKYLVIELDDGTALITHLGMSGRFRTFAAEPPPPGPHDHVDLVCDDGSTVRFTDARRFGLMTIAEGPGHPLLAGLGPEPLGNEFSGPYLAARLKGRRGPVKPALLDQSVVAGMGNIYASESLFRAAISPRRKASTVAGGRAERLAAAIREVLAEAIAAGGSSLRDYRHPDGEAGYFQHHFAVYGRPGEACPGCDCDLAGGGGIRHIVQSGRATFYCARRQR